MDNLVVFAERDITQWLARRGITPCRYYLSLQRFKEELNEIENSVIMIIFSGTCRLSKRYVVSLADEIRSGIEDGTYNNVKEVIVLSDTFLPSCRDYYKYSGSPKTFLHYDRYKKESTQQEKIWENYSFARYDYIDIIKDEPDKAVMVCNIREKRLEDDAYLSLVKVSR